MYKCCTSNLEKHWLTLNKHEIGSVRLPSKNKCICIYSCCPVVRYINTKKGNQVIIYLVQITRLPVHDFWNQTISFRHGQVTNASPSRIAFQLRRASLEIEAIAVKDCEPLVFFKGLVMPTKHGERDGPQYDPYTWQQQMLGVVLQEAKSTYTVSLLSCWLWLKGWQPHTLCMWLSWMLGQLNAWL